MDNAVFKDTLQGNEFHVRAMDLYTHTHTHIYIYIYIYCEGDIYLIASTSTGF
jgi:hypothetical protein